MIRSIYRICIALGIIAGVCFSCKEEKKSTQIIVRKKVEEKVSAVQKMGDYQQSREVEWLEKTYTVSVDFKADPELPLVMDGKQRYYDNRIRLRILRPDGSEFLNREFTKADFLPYLDNTYGKVGALLGIVLDRAEGDNLLFAASVGSPDKSSDEYLPLVMKISRMGNVTIHRDVQLDTSATVPEEREDEGV